MKKIIFLISALMVTVVSMAQTLNVVIGSVTYAIPASEAGDMVYAGGSTLTILNKVYTLADVDSMYIDNTKVTDNTVNVVYNGSTAKVTIAGNCAQYLTATVSGADVSLVQSDDLASELTYVLSGIGTNGSFTMDGSYKATVEFNGLTLASTTTAPISILNGKRIAIVLADGTTSTLTDSSANTLKGCFYCKGHLEFDGSGTLNITGNASNALWAKEYVQLKKGFGTLNILGSQNDGINCNYYFQQNGGVVKINNVGDDGIQCSKSDNDTDTENTGDVIIKGGTMDISVTATAAKGITADGNISIKKDKTVPAITINTTGEGEWDSDDNETKACACISSDANITIYDGLLTLTSTGKGGKGIKCDSVMTINGGTISVTTTGDQYTYGTWGGHSDNTASNLSSSAKGIKSKGNMFINGGTINVSASGTAAEGIESKGTLTITDGTVTVSSNDDCINSSSHMYIKGGQIYVTASGNDGLDSNGNMYIQGGTIVAYGTTAPECGIDANEEQHFTVFFTGGTLIGIGGGNSHPTTSASTQGYVTYSGSVGSGTTLLLRKGTTDILAFTMGRSYSSGAKLYEPIGGGGQGGGGGHGGGGSQGGTSFIITSPNISSGSSYTLYSGASVAGDNWHGLYTAPTVSTTGSTLSTLTAVNYSN
jgi:hypothetical protein